MAKFRFDHFIDIHWNGYDIVGDGGTIFSIPDQLYEEFESDIRPVEPSLEWTVINEFQDLVNSVNASTITGVAPIVATATSTGKQISISSSTAPDGYVLTADGAGGAAFEFSSGGGGGLAAVIGTSPVSVITASGTATVSLNANYSTSTHDHSGTYQPAGTYVTSVSGAAPISATGTTAITVSVDQATLTASAATFAETVRAYVKNTTGSTIPKGSVVYISGSTGDNALISLASASTEMGSSKTLGLTASAIATDGFGYVIENGLISGIDTSVATAGQPVWLGNTPGSFVFGAPPAEPSHSVYLGVVIRVQSNNGEILVKVQNGYELDELHDVSAASPSDGDIIQYKTSSALWTKSSVAGAGIAASVHTHAQVDVASLTSDLAGKASTSHLHTGTYDPAGTAASEVATHEADTTSVHGITNTANLLTTTSGLATIANATATATTISSTTSTAPTDVSGLSHVFTPTYDEDVLVQANLVYTQSASPASTVDIVSRVIVNGTIVSPQGGFTRLAASHGSPNGLTQSFSHTFAAISGTPYTAKVGVYKSSANGTFSASNISSFTITRVRA